MKQKDIALFVVIGVVSAVVSVLASNFVIPKGNKKQEAEVVDPISSSFNVPAADNKYFNPNAINPTKLIQIGDNPSTADPFNGASR